MQSYSSPLTMTIWDSSYEHHNIDEPAILLGGAFVVDILEKDGQP